MHSVEEVFPHLQPIQVSTGPGLLRAFTFLILPLYFVLKKEQKKGASTEACGKKVGQGVTSDVKEVPGRT